MRDLMQTKETIAMFVRMQRLKDPLENNLDGLAELCVDFGEFLSLPPHDREILEKAAYLHDIGHVLVHDQILRYPGRLNQIDWNTMTAHPQIGAWLIDEMGSTFQDVIPVVLFHHERYNGAGYPKGIHGEKIPYLARVFSLCDSWHAMLSDRPYRKAKTVQDAIEDLSQHTEMGMFETKLASQFLSFIGQPSPSPIAS